MKLLKTTNLELMNFKFPKPRILIKRYKEVYWFRTSTKGWEFKYEIN